MTTEITDNKAFTGRIFFDADCALCRRWARRGEAVLASRGFSFASLQDRDARSSGSTIASGQPTASYSEMILLLADGRKLGGANALVEIARQVWWAWPLWAISRVPGMMRLLRAAYRVLATNRHCADGVCLVTHRSTLLDWLPLAALPLGVIVCRNSLADWVFMWLLASAIFLGCKWLTLRRAAAGRAHPVRAEGLAYLLLWPGMDAPAFLKPASHRVPSAAEWLRASATVLSGSGLIWLATTMRETNPLIAGWLGMIGIVLFLHFGSFQLLALSWQSTGRPVKPLMRAPLRATSLADFWGCRWNTAFHALAQDLAFRPLVRRIGVTRATLATFAVSGLIHDLVISLPARGGFGLPTAYFLLQGFGVCLERSRAGRTLGLGRGARGWLFVLVMTAAPVGCLFHPSFIHNVILPMLAAIGATWTHP